MVNKKILMIGPLPPPTGGMETVMEQIVSMKFKNIQIIPFNVSKNKLIKSFILFNIANFIYRCIKLFVILLIKKPDIVHIHTGSRKSFWQNAIFIKIVRFMKKKIIIHIHGGAFKVFYEEQKKIKRKLIKYIIENSDEVVVLSKSWKKIVETITKSKNISILYNSINTKEIDKYNIKRNNNKIIILFVGRVEKEKGIIELINAYKKLNNPLLKLWIMGKYDEKDTFIKTYRTDKSIDFLGEIKNKKSKYNIYADSDIFVLPSYVEAMPMTILEGMASGLPIIATNVGAIPEVIKNNVNGIIIEPKNVKELQKALQKLITDEQMRKRMGKNNKRDIKIFDESKFKIKLEKIWRNY